MAIDFNRFGGYRVGSNIPFGKGPAWEQVARVSRWGAPVIELNTNANTLGKQGLEAIKQQAKANNLVYTWHVPPNAKESGEFAIPNQPNQNEFARNVMAQAIRSAAEVGAKHITFHATSAPRPEKGQLYVYNAQTKQVGVQQVIPNSSPEETVKLLNESAKAQFRTNLNQLESQQKLVNNLERTARVISKKGVDDMNSMQMLGLVGQVSRYSGMVGLQPDNYAEWMRIQDKAVRQVPLTSSEKKIVKEYAGRVLNQLGDYKQMFDNQLKQLKPYEGKDLVLDGNEFMRQNVADNIAKIDKDALRLAVEKGITLGVENLPAHMLFNTPHELNDLRERTIKALVDSKKMTKEEAERFFGFTFDIAHANTVKYIDIAGKNFASPAEFVKQLKGPVMHVHATDSFGDVDGHLPLGQGELTKDEFERLKEALRNSGFKGTAIHELGASQLPVLYGSSMEWVEGNNYFSNGQPIMSSWGPSYLSAAMTDPLMLGKDRGYFYESFADVF